MRDHLAALADYLDNPSPACVIEVGCDDAAAIVAEVRAAREALEAAEVDRDNLWEALTVTREVLGSLKGSLRRIRDARDLGTVWEYADVALDLVAAWEHRRPAGPDLSALRDGAAAGSGAEGGGA